MAFSNWMESLTFEAEVDLSACMYHAVRLSAASKINVASDPAASSTFGVLQNNPRAGEFGTVAWLGTTKVVAGGSVTVGALIANNGSGRAAAVASGGVAIGRALEAAGADGDIITALIFAPIRWAGAI